MGVLLQGFYKREPDQAVPSPADGDQTTPWWWDHLASQASALRLAGFTAVWLPPVLKTSAGAGPDADGYGPFDDYDLGSKHQKGTLETRYGSREQLQRCVASLRATGLEVYLDMVEHQRVGDTVPFVFRYVGSDGTPDLGRFPKSPTHFVPQVPPDPNPGGPPRDGIPSGRELAPINGRPPENYVSDGLMEAADWLTRALGIQGYRLDDVKVLSTDFLFPFLNNGAMAGKFAVGEYIDGNRRLVEGWISNPAGMRGRASAFDFPLKFLLNALCNSPDGFNMASLDHAGLTGVDPLHSVTFVENHDTDLSSQHRIVTNKLLGYAYILTSEGYPCVYYRDYSEDVGCYGLKPHLDNLIWIHENLAAGATQQRFLDRRQMVYERTGASHLLVGLNSDSGGSRTVTVMTGFGPDVLLHDYTGHAGDVTTDSNGFATITVPRNANGLGYVCYSRTGPGGTEFRVTPTPVIQDFEGAIDLDILPAREGHAIQVGRIWCGEQTSIHATLQPDTTGWADATRMRLELLSPDATLLSSLDVSSGNASRVALTGVAMLPGFYTFRLTATDTPVANPAPGYLLRVTYTGDRHFTPVLPASDPAVRGKWQAPFLLRNVAVHAHLLPTGRVLYWGRRKHPTDTSSTAPNENEHENEHEHKNEHKNETEAFLLDTETLRSVPTRDQPGDSKGEPVNLFGSGHAFLPDGRLMVVGGHLDDGQGSDCATLYDPVTDVWSAATPMVNGQRNPTALTLADGSVLAMSGSFAPDGPAPLPHPAGVRMNNTPQVWSGISWTSLRSFDEAADLPHLLYPRMHLAPDGRVFLSGPCQHSYFFDMVGKGTWIQAGARKAGARSYAPSVMYDVGKVIYIGGGNDEGSNLPSNQVEVIDLLANPPVWRTVQPMHFRRRQHNATLLPDGTVLVTGGTGGGDGPGNGFNDLTAGKPVHSAELWNPKTETWTLLDAESSDRCYHSVAVLLPDGSVLSAGGGEYQPDSNLLVANDPADSHLDAQIFLPPYFFKFNGEWPVIVDAPSRLSYREVFEVTTPHPSRIAGASLVRLSSVTHSFNANQRINFLQCIVNETSVKLIAPWDAYTCPPGHYLLFLLDQNRIPSRGKMVQISAPLRKPRDRK